MRKRPRPSLLLAASVCLGLGVCAADAETAGPDLRILESIKERDQRNFDMLLRAKADINAVDPGGSTALAWAVHLGQQEMALALLRAGADVRTADSYGET